MSAPKLFTPKKLCQKHDDALAMGGLRDWIFKENENGLAESGAIIRVGRKVLIDEDKFFEWLTSHAA